MIPISKAPWRVKVVESHSGWWWTAIATANLGLYVSELDGPVKQGCEKKEAEAAWEEFARLNGFTNWEWD